MSEEQRNSEVIIVDVETLYEQFEQLVEDASKGIKIVITQKDQPIAKLTPVQ
jgi:antitoxin (DNA-binding transcriptional repressor) of toxin-antitoxin stability system